MLRILVGITLCVGLVVAFLLSTTMADPLPVGSKAPAVSSVDENGKAVNLEESFKLTAEFVGKVMD